MSKHTRSLARPSGQDGIAMITVMLVLILMSALLVGFTTVIMSDQRYRFIDRDRNQAFYAASAGIEKMTADLGNLFLEYVSPTAAQVTALTASGKLPSITGITYTASQAAAALPASQLTSYHCARDSAGNTKTPTTVGTNGYTLTFCKSDVSLNPTISDDALTMTGTSAYAGMIALQTPYQLDVTAKTATGGEVHLTRTIQAVAIPVFQFAIFSDPDLSFFAGSDFDVAGRVHTNGNLWLAEGPSATLSMTGKVTAFKEVIRQYLSNGISIDVSPTWTGTVSLATGASAPTGNRILARTEGSITGMPGSGVYSGWNAMSLGTSPANYNGYLRNGPGPTGLAPNTGAKKLSLPITATGVTGCTPSPCTNVEIVRRPLAGEDTASILYNERLYTKASIRILLSDTAADITNLPGIDATKAPLSLETNWTVAANKPTGYALGLATPPPALSPGARKGRIATSSGVGSLSGTGPYTYTLKLSNADAAPFKPRFAVCMSNTVACALPANPVTCDVRSGDTFSGCVNVTDSGGASNKPYLWNISPAGGLGGIVSAGRNSTNTTTSTSSFSFPAGVGAQFDALPFWNINDTPPTLITCTGDYSVASGNTTFNGCSSAVAPSNGDVLVSAATADSGISALGGFIKIERNNADGSGWTDVTAEILNYGIGDTNPNVTGGVTCGTTASISPNAIVRLQRLRDNPGGGVCDYNTLATGANDPTNWWPNVLLDTREALQRDWDYPNPGGASPATSASTASDPTYLPLAGVMHYINIDILNLQRWFKHTTAPFNAGTGNLSKIDGTGFSVYFSDRRNNRNTAGAETGEFGWEDFVNPAAANGLPANGTLDTGEDVNENSTLETYGGTPNYLGTFSSVPTCTAVATGATLGNMACSTYASSPAATLMTVPAVGLRPKDTVTRAQALVNRPLLFRRALMLSNAANIGANPTVADRLTGLTIVSENPVYMKGDWNANIPAGTGFGGTNAATAVIADAVTLLSNVWTDAGSFANPYVATNRNATNDAWYRVAILSGKGPSFTKPTVGSGISNDFGTDGGAHNFLRMLEDWSGHTMNYLGSLATLYYNRQAVGAFKCCTTVYGVPDRNFAFDVNFLNPSLLPPLTPMFRDMNVIGFSQEMRPGK